MSSISYNYTQSKYPLLLHCESHCWVSESFIHGCFIHGKSFQENSKHLNYSNTRNIIQWTDYTVEGRAEKPNGKWQDNAQIKNRRKSLLEGQREAVLLQPRGQFPLQMFYQWACLIRTGVAEEMLLLPETTLEAEKLLLSSHPI